MASMASTLCAASDASMRHRRLRPSIFPASSFAAVVFAHVFVFVVACVPAFLPLAVGSYAVFPSAVAAASHLSSAEGATRAPSSSLRSACFEHLVPPELRAPSSASVVSSTTFNGAATDSVAAALDDACGRAAASTYASAPFWEVRRRRGGRRRVNSRCVGVGGESWGGGSPRGAILGRRTRGTATALGTFETGRTMRRWGMGADADADAGVGFHYGNKSVSPPRSRGEGASSPFAAAAAAAASDTDAMGEKETPAFTSDATYSAQRTTAAIRPRPSRRYALQHMLATMALVGLVPPPPFSSSLSSAAASAATGDTLSTLDPGLTSDDSAYPPITHRVYLDVRISRPDGTFYVRDDPPDDVYASLPENRVFVGRIVLGLFGTNAPRHVNQFLRYVDAPYNPADDSPLPTYARSVFDKFDQGTGLLCGGMIPGMELTDIGGGTNLKYGGRILPAPLWIEVRAGAGTVAGAGAGSGSGGGGGTAVAETPRKISHTLGMGLLTHRTLDALPTFGITTRPNPDLDGTHVVFGRVLFDESSREFLKRCVDLPTYSMDRPSSSSSSSSDAAVPRTAGERAAEEAAARIFAAQREFFRGAAKTFGDGRLDNVYEGKLLRRVEVTGCGVLSRP